MTQTALVTGAGRGIGAEFARQLAARGFQVVGTARDPSRYADAPVPLVSLDVGSEESITDLDGKLAEFDKIDLLVNSAGINSKSNGSHSMESSLRLGQLEQESLLHQFRVNAVGPLLLTQALLARLERSESPRVLNVSSWLGSIAGKKNGGNYGYCSSKAALNMVNRTLAADLRERGILSVNFNPGWVRTQMGGGKAELSAEESVNSMLETLFGLSAEDSGRFLDRDGTDHPF